ncbi:hypothetical protein EDC17_101153 [Sphingobacterium alimentarium]|uniref:Uncharacterized protein n=1 Tax=Sphingobacterium alimentarium TaxID=797292 RepID=A0A4V6P318_9SPHI|nr:hypothetical protein EDC17_101153 [Sphingobacterium alimentarium]
MVILGGGFLGARGLGLVFMVNERLMQNLSLIIDIVFAIYNLYLVEVRFIKY